MDIALWWALLAIHVVTVYFLIKANRGISRTLERERNVHNLQVNQLLDRLAHAEGRPWTLPPRPEEPPQGPELLETHWEEV